MNDLGHISEETTASRSPQVEVFATENPWAAGREVTKSGLAQRPEEADASGEQRPRGAAGLGGG